MKSKICRGNDGWRKIQGMKIVAVFLSDETTTRRLTLAFRNRCAVHQFNDFESARERILAENVLAMVVDIRQRASVSKSAAIELIAHLHVTWPPYLSLAT